MSDFAWFVSIWVAVAAAVILFPALGVASAAYMEGFHRHRYRNWKDHGFTYQQGACTVCGKMKIKSK